MMHAACLGGLLVAVALAGCTGSKPDLDDPGAGLIACDVGVSGLPGHVVAGQPFTYRVLPACPYDWTSDHVGSHFSTRSSATADLTEYPLACGHQSARRGNVPAQFACVVPAPGVHYLRAHARLPTEAGGPAEDKWSREYVLVAVDPGGIDEGAEGDPVRVLLYDVPSVHATTTVVTVRVERTADAAAPAVFSDHIGAHYALAPQPQPMLANLTGACQHTEASLPGAFQVYCPNVPQEKIHLRGHVRVDVGDGNGLREFWSREVPLDP